jgi:RHS repeat-associated protein
VIELVTASRISGYGLYYFGARYYDPETGRFLTRDPHTFLPDDPRVVGNSSESCMQWLINPQRFNRFSYTRNNPLRYKDPTGLLFQCIDTECQDFFNEGEDPPPDDLAPEDSHDEYKTREEECRECDCKDRPDIKTLRKLKTLL